MEYSDIMEEQKDRLRAELKWWPNFFYHFTDVHNVVNILRSGWIMSRERVTSTGMMVNDNASRAVLNATNQENKRYGRLYFRPLTPTQYHNEGYKPDGVKDSTLDASCPVPVFLCLNALATLRYPGTLFAEKGLSGSRHDIREGIEEFARLNFEKIYHEGCYDEDNRDIKDYRHSEIIREDGFPVEPLLQCILCRTPAERDTLLYLMKCYSVRMYNSYKERVLYRPKIKCFNHNGVFLKEVSVKDSEIKLEFNDPEQRMKNYLEDIYFDCSITVDYIRNDGQFLFSDEGNGRFNYKYIRSATKELRSDFSWDKLRVQVRFDGVVMYENEIDVEETILF